MENLEALFNTLHDQVGILALGFGAIFSLASVFSAINSAKSGSFARVS